MSGGNANLYECYFDLFCLFASFMASLFPHPRIGNFFFYIGVPTLLIGAYLSSSKHIFMALEWGLQNFFSFSKKL